MLFEQVIARFMRIIKRDRNCEGVNNLFGIPKGKEGIVSWNFQTHGGREGVWIFCGTSKFPLLPLKS